MSQPPIPSQGQNMQQPQPPQNPSYMQQRPPHPSGGPGPMPMGGRPQPQPDVAMSQNLMQMINNQQQRGEQRHQKKERPPSIYVANLPENYFNLELEKLFKSKGHKPIGATVCVDHFTKKPLNYGFVSFGSKEEAAAAAEQLNNLEVGGRFLRISLQQSGQDFKDEKANLFIRNLAPEVTQQEFHDFFKGFGAIRSCKVETFSDGKSRCFGYVQFEAEKSAAAVLKDYESQVEKFMLQGKQFEVFLHLPKDKTKRAGGADAKFTNLFVQNFAQGTDDAQLTAMFTEFGEISSAHVQRDEKESLKPSGFVCFKNSDDAAKALQAMNKKQLPDGNYLLVSQHISKRQNDLSRSDKMQPQPIQQTLTKNFDSNLFVKNVPSEVSEEAFKNEFARFGTVISVRFRTNPHVPQATFKQAFVLFEDVDAAKAAIKNMDQTAPFGHKPISVDFWVSKQELENERFAKEQAEMFNWFRHSEDQREQQMNMQQQSMGGGGMQGGYGNQSQGGFQPRNNYQQRPYQQNRGGRQGGNRGGGGGGNYRGGGGGGYQQNNRDQRPRQNFGQDQRGPPQNNAPIMNQANFPNALPQQQNAPSMAPPQQPQQIQSIRFPEVNLVELDGITDRNEKLKFVGNAIYFPIQDVHGEMAGKITGCLLDGVAEFESLVRDPDFLNKNVHQVYQLLMQQAQQQNQQMPPNMQVPPMQQQMMQPPMQAPAQQPEAQQNAPQQQ